MVNICEDKIIDLAERSIELADSIIKSDLSYAYKILSFLKLDDHTYTHLSSRSSDGKSYFIYPFGLRFEEVEPESLLRVSLEGEILEGSEYQYNKTGYIIHGSIYQARSDVNSIFHIHTPEIVAVSCHKDGLLPYNQWALHFYNKIAYHEYNSLALDGQAAAQLVRDLGEKFVMLLRSHGSITCGKTVKEAMFYTYHLQQACKTQCYMSAFMDRLVIPSETVCEKSVHDLLNFEKDLGDRDWNAWTRLVKRNEISNR